MHAALLLSAVLSGCAHPPEGGDDTAPEAWIPPDADGAYGASATTLRWTDARGQDLVAEVWYPVDACDEPEPYEELPLTGKACRDLPPAEGPFPLVAFSHGYSGIRYQSIFLTEALAQHGYVVVAVDHPRNTLLDLDPDATGEVALRRPGDVVASVDEVFRRSAEGDALLGGLVEPDRYAMTGHSFGGWTTLAVAGGVADFWSFQAFCATDPGFYLCSALAGIPEGATIADAPDPRAVVGMPMAMGGWYSFGEAGLAGLAPTLVWGGDRDDGFPVDTEIRPLYERLPAPKALGVIAGAGHYAFSDICRIGDLVDECAGAEGGWIELDLAHTIVRELAIAWIGLHLRGDERYAEWLESRWPELSFEEP